MFKLDLEKLEELEIKLPTSAGGGGLVAKSCLTLVTPWTVACQAPRSMGFSRQEYWSGLPFPSPGDLPDPGIEPASPALQADSYQLSYEGSPRTLEWVACPFSSGSSQPRNRTRVTCIVGRFFTN